MISIHVPRVGDDWNTTRPGGPQCISIHVPRVGDDGALQALAGQAADISIHVPRVGDDHAEDALLRGLWQFLSTSPAWGTTHVGANGLIE